MELTVEGLGVLVLGVSVGAGFVDDVGVGDLDAGVIHPDQGAGVDVDTTVKLDGLTDEGQEAFLFDGVKSAKNVHITPEGL